MQPTNMSIRRLAGTVGLALIVFAVAAAGAAGSAGASGDEFIPGVTDFPSRLAEPPEEFIPGVTDFPSRLGESAENAAVARVAQLSEQGTPVYVRAEETGFDWSAGATGAIAATLLLLGAALAVRTARRSRLVLG
jgi:hypothetical protein